MRAQDHPEYATEKQRLDDTIQAIDEQLEPYRERKEIEAAYGDASEALAHLLTDTLRRLRSIRSEPYFGRFDFRRDGNTAVRTFYIGKEGVARQGGSDDLVYDWRAPISELFYVNEFVGATYKAPRGPIRGDVLLRRRFKVADAELIDISDEVPLPSSVVAATVAHLDRTHAGEPAGSDEFLVTILAQHRDARLRDIVATIQAQQNALIRAPLDRVLLIQGVAGSGKTSVALHRIAYLLYAFQDRLDARRIAVFGPSRLFLQSIADVLPGLGVQEVMQTTFEEWAQSWIKPSVRIDSSDEPLERFLDHAADRRANVATFLRGRLRGSMRMGRLLREHVALLRRRSSEYLEEMAVTYEIPFDEEKSQYLYRFAGREVPVRLNADEIRSAIRTGMDTQIGKNQPLNIVRDHVCDQIANMLWDQFKQLSDASLRVAVLDRGKADEFIRRQHFVTAVRAQIDRSLGKYWPRMTAVDCYKRLVTSRGQLETANNGPSMLQGGQLSEGEINLLLVPNEKSGTSEWAFEDLPILSFLDLLLNGRGAMIFDYIIIDEAQDVSPLQVEVLRHHAKGGSMTLLGDIAQGVYSYRGIQRWSELREIFQSTQFATAKLAISYRSTYEITTLANDILARAHLPEKVTALPVQRHGFPPGLHQCADWAELVREAIACIRIARANGMHSAAIVCKTAKVCRLFAEQAIEMGLDSPVLVLSKSSTTSADTMLTPAYLAKGLEFDCVVLAGADADAFTESEYDAKLLYVSITRALHELHVLWVGKPATLLAPTNVAAQPRQRQK